MKIYQALSNPYLESNQYVMTLMDGIDSQHDVEWGWGIEKFWSIEIYDYDIVHIHWPQVLLWPNRTSEQIKKRLLKLKEAGCKIVTTCHNLEPHYCLDNNIIASYEVAYSFCDLMIHLGEYSKNIMKEKYPHAKHVVLPHHVYDTVYGNCPQKDECRIKLHLKQNAKYIICFGAFRNSEENILVEKLARKLRRENVYFIAPSFMQVNVKGFFGKVKKKLIRLYYHYVKHIIFTGNGANSVSVNNTPYYYGASDMAFIQRMKILNSGNVPLAFLMGKVVVGPNIGNLGEELRKTSNPTFEPMDNNSILNAVHLGLQLSSSGMGNNNRSYALEHLCTKGISAKLYEYYSSLY